MDSILEDLGTLATDQMFQTVIQKQVDHLAKAREELAKVPQLLPRTEECFTIEKYSKTREYSRIGRCLRTGKCLKIEECSGIKEYS